MQGQEMQLHKLPLGIQSFAKLREEDCLYIDKTEAIHHLTTRGGRYYFLSRPRRFGKSLLVSTLKELYSGHQALFKGLWIEPHWDWTKKPPVIALSFANIGYRNLGLEEAIRRQLLEEAQRQGLSLHDTDSIALMLATLLKNLATQYGRVVLLIDEYDKPLIDYVDDLPQAQANQQVMKTFYSVIKDSDDYLEFMLVTGVSKFSKVSIFSDLNHLSDLTLHKGFSDLVGYTQAELEHYFAPYFSGLEQSTGLSRELLLAKIQQWYNGYTWDLQTHIYNPFSILNLIDTGEFRNFWFESGTPSFVPKLMHQQGVYRLTTLEVTDISLGNFDLERLEITPIMFQTGYLTFKSRDAWGFYTLGYPNYEVENSMSLYLLAEWSYESAAQTNSMMVQLYRAFRMNELSTVIELLNGVFSKIPSHIFLQKQEAYYHSLIYLTFFYLGQYAEAEVNTNKGRMDCVVKTPQFIYILEFKRDKSAAEALAQIHSRAYATSFRADPRPKVLIGINFKSELKAIDDWVVEEQDSGRVIQY